MALRLTLVRHAPTRLNRERRYTGHLNPALDPLGEDMARAVRRRLAPFIRETEPPHLWSSDLERARRTAELAVPGVEPRTDARLRELDFGAFDGLTYRENLVRHGPRFRRWIDDPAQDPPPGGESLRALVDRVVDWLHDLPTDGNVVAVTHGGPLRVLASRTLGLRARDALPWSPPPGTILRTTLRGAPDGRSSRR